jgi:hypothetical protein
VKKAIGTAKPLAQKDRRQMSHHRDGDPTTLAVGRSIFSVKRLFSFENITRNDRNSKNKILRDGHVLCHLVLSKINKHGT